MVLLSVLDYQCIYLNHVQSHIIDALRSSEGLSGCHAKVVLSQTG